MRFIIHGAGSIGSLIGGRLAESGAEVILIARHAHAAAIDRGGLLIQSREGDRVVKSLGAVTHPRDVAPKDGDVIILTVKSSQTASSVQALREAFPEETPVVCMQNGVRNEEMAAGRFLRVYGGMLGISATFLEPGKIAHTRGGLLSISNYPLGCDDTGFQIAACFEKAGFKATTHESIMAVKWSKLILNLNNATFAIIDKHLQLGMVTPAISNFMADVQEEGLRALNVAGISLEDSKNPIDLKRQLAELRSVVEDPEKIRAEADSPAEFRTYPSTWMDLKLKRGETETGYFNGEIILLGEKYHIPTPYNSTLFNIVETMAVKGAQPGLCDIEELADFVERRRRKLEEQ
ncbi:MAG TPA: 2-dehydropantoate 2-reductase [Blastocatellia bacterium]|jgi:2-dehydropantoate 2-reductase|nr:2-dehydropantoate 2-reductase [Blastocatellia bacterium]